MDREYRPAPPLFPATSGARRQRLYIRTDPCVSLSLQTSGQIYRTVYVEAADKRHNVIHITLKCFFNVT
ncbi:hypothetical protein F6I15_07215 [Escherichia coli]|nr:hypothetical protein F6I15_07215 [Escherichia coli]RRM34743.1 hypothetical protein DU304_16855 [Escherichia coli]HAH3520081.1 hypothetical protein [Escherichia coli]